MAVRRAAGAKWAARRAEDRKNTDYYDDAVDGEPMYVASPDQGMATPKAARRQRKDRNMMASQDWNAYGGPYAAQGSPYAQMPHMAGYMPPWMFPPPAAFSGMPMPPPMFHGMPMPMAPPPSGPSGTRAQGKKPAGKPDSAAPAANGVSAASRKKKGGGQGAEDGGSAPEDKEEDLEKLSPLLRKVRQPHAHLTVNEILPEVVDFATDKHGSRFLMTKLDEASRMEQQAIFQGLLAETVQLSNDMYGFLVVQRLFERGTADQKRAMMAYLHPVLVQCAKDAHGCRVVQTAIAETTRDSQQVIAAEIAKDVHGCIESKHGNHVIQKCIEQMPPGFVDFIIAAVEEDTDKMASHSYGCRVVQRLLEHCKMQKLETMLDHIITCLDKLAKDPYGNYVVQHVLQYGRYSDKTKIMVFVRDNIVNLSMYRFSSNVVEKCFSISSIGEHAQTLEEERAALMQALLGQPGNPASPVFRIMEDRFGNHVLMAVFKLMRSNEEKELMQQQLMAAENLSAMGKRILQAIADGSAAQL